MLVHVVLIINRYYPRITQPVRATSERVCQRTLANKIATLSASRATYDGRE